MMSRMSLIALLAAVTACGPLTAYHKPGVAVTRLDQDLLSCQVKALDQAPVATVIRQGPPRFYPGRQYCDAAGNCHIRGGFWVPGEVYSADANKSLRVKLENQCMAGNGYQRVQVPRCSQSFAVELDTAGTEVLPPLSDTSCAIREKNGSVKIVSDNRP